MEKSPVFVFREQNFKKGSNIGIRCEGLVGPLVVTPRHPDVKSFYFEFLKFPLFPKPYQVGV
jgi:hypothetical protein